MPFFDQIIKYKSIPSRVAYFNDLIKNKKVLHIGCADSPIYNFQNCLHGQLAGYSKLDGFDLDKNTLEIMSRDFSGFNFYSSYCDLKQQDYDFILIPETIEHVDNIQLFLRDINDHLVKGKLVSILITGPNAFCKNHMERNITKHEGDNNYEFTEIVHPDHKMWFSLYTLSNCIKQYTSWKIVETVLLEKDTMVSVLCTSQ
jgi:2-polyprenyl-3-methyl-5-hydroxy-6-metoxy-1,4-benzoquinol methylase